ncbi:transmembrane protein 79-like [Heteronotia binoei]|uniref:transmembrane protein 79-like n=1 Tax=Heteronotia binoei TaxID=13085 RepID=UPI00292F701F|nr:transmembrane protein 79-like [Heteronotia binoei]
MTAKSPACQRPLKELEGTSSSFTDIAGQLQDIDPSRLSLSPFLDLDTLISLSPISDSPESSVEELHSTEDEDVQEENDCNLVTVEVPEVIAVDLTGQPQTSVVQENPGPPEMAEGAGHVVLEGSAFQDGAQAVAITVPDEASFLDTVQPLLASPLKSMVQQGHLETIGVPDRHEHQPFLEVKAAKRISHRGVGDSCHHSHCCRGCSSDHMKAVASAFVALLLAPWFLYGFYYCLPFKAPACPDLTSRIAFALRSLLVASVPILLGITFRSAFALFQDNLDPLYTSSRAILLQQMFVAASMDQFAIFSLNLLVTATFLPQEHLRLIPVLAGLFTVSRFCYGVALIFRSSYRSFGFGLAFFPNLCLTAYNFYCLYNVGFGFLFMPAPSGYAHPTATPVLPRVTVSN